jgi:hypothetical protein
MVANQPYFLQEMLVYIQKGLAYLQIVTFSKYLAQKNDLYLRGIDLRPVNG